MKISLAAHRYFYYLFFFIMPACSGKKSLGKSRGKKSSLGDDCPSIAPSTTLSDSPSMTPSVSSFPSGSPETPLGGTCEDEEVTQVLTSSDCFQEITAPGLYVLEDDIACDFNDDLGSTNIAFKFTGNDITLNCNGHTISGVNAKETAISGLFLRGQGINVINCEFTGFGNGVNLDGADNYSYVLDGITSTNNDYGLFYFSGGTAGGASVIITGSHFDNNDADGMQFDGAGEVTVTSTSANGNLNGIFASFSSTKLTLLMVEAIDNLQNGLQFRDSSPAKQIINSRLCGNVKDINVPGTQDGVTSLLGVTCDNTNLDGGCNCEC